MSLKYIFKNNSMLFPFLLKPKKNKIEEKLFVGFVEFKGGGGAASWNKWAEIKLMIVQSDRMNSFLLISSSLLL